MASIVNTIAKTPVVSAYTHDNAMTLTLTFQDGRTLQLDATTLSQDIINSATLHGLKQKLIDAAAIGRDAATGRSATLDDKYDAVREVFDRITLAEGATWNKVRVGGESATVGGLFVRAIMSMSPGKTRADVVAYLDALTKEQRAALKTNQRVVTAMNDLRETSEVDTDSLLDGIIGG